MNVIDDATLLKLAEAEILQDAKRAAIRHSTAGVSGWRSCPKPNKVFLANTLLQTIAGNRLLSKKKNGKGDKALKPKKRDRKLLQNNKGERTNFVYQKPKQSEEKPNTAATSNNKFRHHSNSENGTFKKTVDIRKKNVHKVIKLNKP